MTRNEALQIRSILDDAIAAIPVSSEADTIMKITTSGFNPYVWRVNKTTIGSNTYSDTYRFAANIPYKLVCVRVEGFI